MGSITHGMENFIIRSLLFVILAGLTTGFGYSTMMGGIAGLVLELTIPTPVRFYLFPSLLGYGVVFDIILHIHRSITEKPGHTRVFVGTVFASLAMSAIALSVFTLIGFFPPQLVPLIWIIEISLDILLGVVGAIIGLALLRQLIHLKPT